MRSSARQAPRGQVLVMVAAGMVVLMGVTALAVDLGFSWMLRRQEQNAADPAAIAAARHLKDELGMPAWDQAAAEADACLYAQQNGFFESDTGCVSAIASGDLQVWSPPVSGPYSGRPSHVQVIIRDTHPSFFGRIFGSSEALVATAAVAVNTAGNSNSASLVALQDVCEGGAAGKVDGGGTVRIFPAGGVTAAGGHVHVNSPCAGSPPDNICDNGAGASGLHISGRLETTFASVVGLCTVQGSDPADGLFCPDGTAGCLKEGAVPLGDPLYFLPEPALNAFPAGVCPNGSVSLPTDTSGCELKKGGSICPEDVNGVGICVMSPGVYYGGWDVKAKVRVEMQPGMYILAGGGIKLTGTESSIEGVSDESGDPSRLTIFSTDGPGCATGNVAQCQGDITFTASQAFKARATPGPPGCGTIMPGYNLCPWRGILLWQDGTTVKNVAKTVKLGGQASTILAGTIYAPKDHVEITGGSDTDGCSGTESASCLSIQIISWTWKISGNATLDMPYDPSQLYQLDQRGLVH